VEARPHSGGWWEAAPVSGGAAPGQGDGGRRRPGRGRQRKGARRACKHGGAPGRGVSWPRKIISEFPLPSRKAFDAVIRSHVRGRVVMKRSQCHSQSAIRDCCSAEAAPCRCFDLVLSDFAHWLESPGPAARDVLAPPNATAVSGCDAPVRATPVHHLASRTTTEHPAHHLRAAFRRRYRAACSLPVVRACGCAATALVREAGPDARAAAPLTCSPCRQKRRYHAGGVLLVRLLA
jgi:hypothetical protein